MKLYDRPRTKETLDRLPEMPEGVVVPDDVSGLQPPTALKATAGAYRWMRWLAAIVVLAAAGALAAVLFTGGDNATEIAQVEELGSDRHLATMADLTFDQVELNYMEVYGTDNPTFITATVPALGSDRHLATTADLTADQVEVDYMELYGTDNPTFVEPAPELPPTEGPGSNSLAP